MSPRTLPADPTAADAVGVGVFADRLEAGDVPGPLDRAFLDGQGFTGKPGQTCVVPGGDGAVVVAVGLGEEGDATVATYRRAAAALARAAQRQTPRGDRPARRRPRSDWTAPTWPRPSAEGVVLGAYRYTELKSDPEPSRIESLLVVGQGRQAGRRRRSSGDGRSPRRCAWPATSSTSRAAHSRPRPSRREPRSWPRPAGSSVEVLDRAAIEDEKLGGLLGVNRGSDEEPRFVKLAWEPDAQAAGRRWRWWARASRSTRAACRSRPATSMMGMKGDMAGAAAVLAAFSALDTVRPPVRVLGYLPLTDNMPGGDATRVGDVLRIRNGTTVEVLNTDAEGRLVLADALSLASEAEPDAIVDLATLTGACMVALGTKIAGLMGNHDGLRRRRCAPPPTPRASPCGRCRCPTTCGASSTPRWPT